MRLEEFIKNIASEPERTFTRTVWNTPRDVLARAAQPGGLALRDLLSAPGRRAEQRVVQYRHILGSPAREEEVNAWQSLHPRQRLPSDLRELVLHMNGIHLWANVETGRAYSGLAPIEEWDLARLKLYGSDLGELLDWLWQSRIAPVA